MAYEFKLPDIGEGVHEGEIVSWLVKEGDQVDEDQDIVEVMTDKATVQLSSPVAGTIAKINFQEGDVVNVGDVFVVISTDGDPKPTKDEPTAAGTNGDAAAADDEAEAGAAGEAAAAEEKTLFDLPSDMGASRGKRPARARGARSSARQGAVLAMPKVRQAAKEKGIDLAQVQASGAHGHVTMADLDQATRRPAEAPGASVPANQFDIPSVDREMAASVEPIKGLRKRIASNMARAKSLQAHFTYVVEVRADKLVEMRKEMKEATKDTDVNVTFLPIITKAVVRALKKHPRINALVDENAQELVLMGPCNVGIAAQTERGLVVPVVHDAEKKSILQIARDIEELSDKARDQKLSMDDITGGTFTITSLGKIGGLLATPILAHPQVAIMGVHAIRDVPVVEDGEVVPGKVMNLAFTFDHRLIDGYDGALFAQDVVRYLEEPNLLLLESV